MWFGMRMPQYMLRCITLAFRETELTEEQGLCRWQLREPATV